MLGKLIKHEFLATWKILLLLDAVMLGVGIIGFFVLSTMGNIDELSDSDYFGVIFTSYFLWFIFYSLAILAVNLGTIIFLMIRYYRHLYSAEGYLTFTLPVETQQILHAKMISGYAWIFAGFLLTLFSVVLMLLGLLSGIDPRDRAEFLQGLSEMFVYLSIGNWVLLVLTGLLAPLKLLLTIYFCITAGQLWQKHRIAGAVLCYVGLNFLTRSFRSFSSIGRMLQFAEMDDFDLNSMYLGSLSTSLIFGVILCAAFYVAIRLINKTRVNLG